jgi:hypothetical protein
MEGSKGRSGLRASPLARAGTAACSAHADLASNAWQRTIRNAIPYAPWLVPGGLTATVADFQKLVLETFMCSSRATFLFYLAVLASSILCAASTAFAPQKPSPGQDDIALAAREAGGMHRDLVMSGVLTPSITATTTTRSLKVASTNSENRRSCEPSAADDLAIEFASPLTGASQL